MTPTNRALSSSALCALLLITSLGVSAQTLGPLKRGEPVVADSTGNAGATASSSPVYVDASKFTGDICARINSAIRPRFQAEAVQRLHPYHTARDCSDRDFSTANAFRHGALGQQRNHDLKSRPRPFSLLPDGRHSHTVFDYL
jgi:hypothetical protein